MKPKEIFADAVINRNMRCIEISPGAPCQVSAGLINRNMRCIEINQ